MTDNLRICPECGAWLEEVEHQQLDILKESDKIAYYKLTLTESKEILAWAISIAEPLAIRRGGRAQEMLTKAHNFLNRLRTI